MLLGLESVNIYINYSKNKIDENRVDVRCSRPSNDLKFDHFTLLSRGEWETNVSKC